MRSGTVVGVLFVAASFLLSYGCPKPKPAPSKDASVGVAASGPGTRVTVKNESGEPTTVYAAFGSDSHVRPSDWTFCAESGPLNCSFALNKSQDLPAGGYLNVTLAFGKPVGCGVTKVEINVNNPSWYDVVDLSLVDGYSTPVSMTVDGITLGPVTGPSGNEGRYGVYPLGCDLCVARSSQTPCGQSPGASGCKAGTQYDPKPPCQHQGKIMGGGNALVVVTLLQAK